MSFLGSKKDLSRFHQEGIITLERRQFVEYLLKSLYLHNEDRGGKVRSIEVRAAPHQTASTSLRRKLRSISSPTIAEQWGVGRIHGRVVSNAMETA